MGNARCEVATLGANPRRQGLPPAPRRTRSSAAASRPHAAATRRRQIRLHRVFVPACEHAFCTQVYLFIIYHRRCFFVSLKAARNET